jgi:hypothetical protein
MPPGPALGSIAARAPQAMIFVAVGSATESEYTEIAACRFLTCYSSCSFRLSLFASQFGCSAFHCILNYTLYFLGGRTQDDPTPIPSHGSQSFQSAVSSATSCHKSGSEHNTQRGFLRDGAFLRTLLVNIRPLQRASYLHC